MSTLRAFWKILRGLAHVLRGLWIITRHFPRLGREAREQRVQVWSLQFLALWGIHLQVLGQPVRGGPALIVANHISWLDILVIHAARYCRFVSKSDVRDWPLIGGLATAAGTLYIERTSRRDALRMVGTWPRPCETVMWWRCSPKAQPAMAKRCCPFMPT